VHLFSDKFGVGYFKTWRFETLNEPDLKMYNRQNLTLAEYLDYVKVSSNILAKFDITLWGPAGLFKDLDLHPLCWGSLSLCQKNRCPFEVLTFHKKGNESASAIVDNSAAFAQQVQKQFPHLDKMHFANT